MAKLAIRGHVTRGRKVIKLLEMLGGKNSNYCVGTNPDSFYFIDDNNVIDFYHVNIPTNYTIFTLEEFYKKFPYKVGDKVQHKGATSCGSVFEVEKLLWEDNQVKYIVNRLGFNNDKTKVTSKDLQTYKEETMEEKIEVFENLESHCKDEVKIEVFENLESHCKDEVKIEVFEILESHCKDEVKIEFDPSKFEMVERENGYYVVRKKPQYPTTYNDCCDILGFKNRNKTVQQFLNSCDLYDSELMTKLSMLKVCRDAYWKIAGEELGLEKPWEPDWDNLSTNHEFIKINKGCFTYSSLVLVFPTEKMRDTFYENFKNEIEQCKELL